MRRRFNVQDLAEYRGVSITVDSDGSFRATVAGDHLRADTLKALQLDIEKRISKTKVKIAVPISELGQVWKSRDPRYSYRHEGWVAGTGVRHVTLTGIHAATAAVLGKDDRTGKSEQFGRSWGGDKGRYVRRLTDDEIARYVELETARRAATDAFDAFMETVKLPDSLTNLVKAAQGEKLDTPDEPEEAEDDDPR